MILIIIITENDLKKIRERDPEIFTNIYNEYKKKIYNFIIIKTNGNTYAADEIFSETFYSALVSAPNIKNVDNILGWLLSIANRRLYDYISKENKNRDRIEEIINVETIAQRLVKYFVFLLMEIYQKLEQTFG
jgi:DNA-directed RNA polymerase specialized sigma24 family protein